MAKKSSTAQLIMLGRVVSHHSPAMLTKQFAQHKKKLDEMMAEGAREVEKAQAPFLKAAVDPDRYAPYQPNKLRPLMAAPKVAEQPFLEQVEPAARTRPVRL
jgi:hypothetical protein